jgi:hypothetical protein
MRKILAKFCQLVSVIAILSLLSHGLFLPSATAHETASQDHAMHDAHSHMRHQQVPQKPDTDSAHACLNLCCVAVPELPALCDVSVRLPSARIVYADFLPRFWHHAPEPETGVPKMLV